MNHVCIAFLFLGEKEDKQTNTHGSQKFQVMSAVIAVVLAFILFRKLPALSLVTFYADNESELQHSDYDDVIFYPRDDSERRLKFVGQVRNKIPHGHGTMTWTDGQIYEGHWKDGQMDGQGKITYVRKESNESGLDYYYGEFKDGKKAGTGTGVRFYIIAKWRPCNFTNSTKLLNQWFLSC